MKNKARISIPSFLLLVISLSLIICLIQIQAAYTQIKIKTPVTLPLQISDEGHLVVKATINGVEGNFIFDTAAGLNLITKKFADKLKGLTKMDGFYTGHRATGEAMELDLWNIKSMKVGNLGLTDQVFTIMDVDFPLDGLISLLPFKDIPLTINYKTKSIVIESANSLNILSKSGKSIPLQIADHREKALDIFAYVKVNDKLTLQVCFDSGAGSNVYRFNSKFMNSLGIETSKAETSFRKSSFNPNMGNKFYTTKISELALVGSDIVQKDIKTSFIEGLIYDGITSMNWLGDRITIDIPNKRLVIN